jgi:hypothetical protein
MAGRSGRRSFLKLVGGVLGAGVGLVATGTAGAQSCAISCAVLHCGGSENCSLVKFRCTSACGGTFDVCLDRPCTWFCLSQHAC